MLRGGVLKEAAGHERAMKNKGNLLTASNIRRRVYNTYIPDTRCRNGLTLVALLIL